MKRKLLSTILLGLMTFLLASCTSVSNTTTKNDVTPGKTTEVPGSSTSDNTPGTTSNTPVSTSENIPTTTTGITPSTTGTIPTTTTGNIPTTTTGSPETTTSTTPIEEHTVSFYSDNVLIDTKTVKDGEKVSAIADPIKESDGEYNYTFDCWYYNNAAFNFNTEIKENIVLTAKWNQTIIQYDFIIIDSISNSQIYSTKVNAKSKATEPTLPAKSGYTFKGFYTDTTYSIVYDFNTVITKKTTIYAKYESSSTTPSNINVTSYKGFAEGAYIEFDRIQSLNEASDYDVYYLGPNDNDFVKVNDNLVRLYNTYVRADIVGLAAGNYTLRIVANAETKDLNVKVTQDDRSGYAHSGVSSVGAYNNDGTLKDNATVVYVSNENKNTVTATFGGNTYTGLVNIIKNANASYPLDIRILDDIQTCQFNTYTYASARLTQDLIDEQAASLGGNYSGFSAETIIANNWNSYSNDIANGITELNGLSSSVSYGGNSHNKSVYTDAFDTAWNMCNISSKENITIEGIGTDAGLFQWGFNIKSCKSIEIKNLRFHNYTEDAVGIEGGSNFWLHNNTFDIGVNNWDFSDEKDKGDGDGATDFKKASNLTISYCRYNHTHKTNLIGGDDKNQQWNVTLHHNYYNQCSSRLPLGRQANMHFYNNYYYKCSTCQDIRANAFVLSEYNYFENCSNPQKVTVTDTYTGTVIKSFNDILINCGSSAATVVTSRTQALDGNCNGGTYNNFDTNTDYFYYDSENQKSDVMVMNEASELPTLIPTISGAGLCPNFNIEGESGSDTPVERFTVTFETNGGTAINSQTVISGNKISAVSTTKSGYKLVGWYKDATFSTPFNISTDTITEDTNLYAKWEATSLDPQTGNTLTLTIPSETGDKTENFTAGDFTITATSDKKVTVNSNYISLNGGGSITYRSIVATVNTTNEITITINVSGGSNNRYLIVADENGTSLSETLVTGETLIIKASGHTTYYLYSKSSGLNVSTLTITY